MSFNERRELPCGCTLQANYYGVEIDMCELHTAAPDLLRAVKMAMVHLTGETEEEWRRSQSYEEAPYHDLYVAIAKAEPKKE